MYKTCLILLSLGCVFFLEFASAQTNHVFNGDFELYDTCPTSESGPFDLQINHCTGWTTPTYATSDYFNSCAVGTNVYVPSNILGYQFPLSGNGYCGFLATSFDTLSNYIWWEYIQGGIQPLSQNRIYKLSINLNLAEDSYYLIDNIGVHLSDNQISDFSSTLPLSQYSPQFLTPNNVYISDTAKWVQFEWYFVASGNEKFITIGNFNDFFNSNAVLSPQGGTMGNSYIFIDDVSIIEATNEVEISNVFTPNNDGLNDLWNFSLISSLDKTITILNRWGQIVSSGSLGNFSWDGKDKNGNFCQDGVYFYIAEFSEDNKITGFVQLVR